MKRIYLLHDIGMTELVLVMTGCGLAITLWLLLAGYIEGRVWADVTKFLFGGGGLFRIFWLWKMGKSNAGVSSR